MSWPVPGVDACPLVDAEGYGCGLLWGHLGGHTRHIPGGYLPAPILHPFDWLLVKVRMSSGVWLCPNGCPSLRRLRGTHGDYISDLRMVSGEGWMTVHYMADEQPHIEVQATLRFEPCGCEFRQLAPPDEHEAAGSSVMFVYG